MSETERIIIESILNEYRSRYYILTEVFMREVNDDIRACGIKYTIEDYDPIKKNGKIQLTRILSN